MTNINVPSGPEPFTYGGLSSIEIEALRRTHGFNVLTPPPRDAWWTVYLAKYEDPVIRILIMAALIAIVVGLFTGHYAEGAGIICAILLATTLAFINEHRAGREFDLLSSVNDDVAVRVRRDGTVTTVARRELVPGDVVLIEKGEEVPADGIVVRAVKLQVDESHLTGESLTSTKCATGVAVNDPDRVYPPDNVFRGTYVADGHGEVQVNAIGDMTEIGKSAREAVEEAGVDTPLKRQLEKLSKLIGVVGTAVALLTFVALVVRGAVVGELVLSPPQWTMAGIAFAAVALATVRVWLPIAYDGFAFAGMRFEPPAWLEREGVTPWLQAMAASIALAAAGVSGIALRQPLAAALPPAAVTAELLNFFMVAVTIIVVAVPEGLAMSVTLSLAYSMRKMTATNTLVRRMHACETIGAATVICTDKTGTLTMNEMRVRSVSVPWRPGAALEMDWTDERDRLLAEAVAANSTADLDRSVTPPQPVGNCTEGALLLWLDASHTDYVAIRDRFTVTNQWTFSADRKFMATLGTSSVLGGTVLHVKGAPELVLNRCTKVMTDGGETPIEDARAVILAELHDFQSRGMRTLGLAFARNANWRQGDAVDSIASDLTWLGCVAVADPVRADAAAALAACRRAGIEVKIVTGDHAGTAVEVARVVGLLRDVAAEAGDVHVGGAHFAGLDGVQSERAAAALRILSRAKPADKLKLVRALQRQGHVVAVTGDGTNDAPALNHADVGLAMGKSGTAVAKEASDIVLLDDSFRSIATAVRWGRSLYENIQRFILFQLTINVAALGVALAGPFVGIKLPLTVTQMLWINLIMDTFAALALATEPPHDDVMARPPRGRDAFIITPSMARSIFGVGALFLALLLMSLIYIRRDGVVDAFELSSFFTFFVLLQFWNLFNARCLGSSRSASAGLFDNKAFLGIAAAILVGQICIVQFGGALFRTVPLSVGTWVAILAATSPVLLIGEASRWLQRRQTGVAVPAEAR